MPNPEPRRFDLYIDESGSFLETTQNCAQRGDVTNSAQGFPSQLAGLLVPSDSLTRPAAIDILNRSFASAGLARETVPHGAEIKRGPTFDKLITEILAHCKRRNWQPVRLVNLEQVAYGERSVVYTNLVAEIVLRICQEKRKEGLNDLQINVFYAVVKTGERNGQPVFIEREEYCTRLSEYLAYAAVRHGHARHAKSWRLGKIAQYSARLDPELALCDLISNASFANFAKCGQHAAVALRAALGSYDMSLWFNELLERLDRLLAEDSLGHAVIAMAERLTASSLDDGIRCDATQRLDRAIHRLAEIGSPARDAHLNIVIDWLAQMVDVQRLSEVSYGLANWLTTTIGEPLARSLGARDENMTIDWFTYALHLWALTACNRTGSLETARSESMIIDKLAPAIAGRWEHAVLLIRGLVAQSVHEIDCFEHDNASRRMKAVASYFADLAELFAEALPGVFPQRVRSDMRGQALGTWLQSEIYAGLRDKHRLDKARSLSDDSIDEFSAPHDRMRQFQYRSQLETAAGDLPAARRYLAQSLGLDHYDDTDIAGAILHLRHVDVTAEGFALRHWLRIGRSTCSFRGNEQDSFLAALRRTSVLSSSWCKGELTRYPAHGILRELASIRAVEGNRDEAISLLRQLQRIVEPLGSCALVPLMILAATAAEVSGELWQRERRHARLLLGEKRSNTLSLREILEVLDGRCRQSFPAIWGIFAAWPRQVASMLSGELSEECVRTQLLELARPIGY